MKVTINNLLTESMIDDLPSFNKMDKAVLKFLHQNKRREDYWEQDDAYQVWDLMKTFALKDGDYIFKMWNIYKKYGNILFDDMSKIENYTPDDYDKAADVIIMNYYDKNVVEKMVYPGWQVEIMEPLEVMLAEDMITMEIRHIHLPPTIFVNLRVSDIKRQHELTLELFSMDEDNWGDHMVNTGKSQSKQRDAIGFVTRAIDPPVNLSDGELKKYFDEIFDEAHEFIDLYDEEMQRYYTENRPAGGWRWER